jgi:hypothetical protein
LREKKPWGRQWGPDFCCMTPPSIGIISGERKFCCWRKVLQRHCRGLELFSHGGPLQNPWSPFRRSVKGAQHLGTVWQETAVKVYHAEKT